MMIPHNDKPINLSLETLERVRLAAFDYHFERMVREHLTLWQPDCYEDCHKEKDEPLFFGQTEDGNVVMCIHCWKKKHHEIEADYKYED